MSLAAQLLPLLALGTMPGAGPTAAGTGAPAQVAIVTMAGCCPSESWPAAERRVEAELRLLGLSVTHVPGQASDERARRLELATAARATRSVAALRLVRFEQADGGRVEIWLSDRLTRKLSLRTVRLQDHGPAAAAVVALRVVELLRASLMEIRTVEAARGGEMKVPLALSRLVTPNAPSRPEPVWALRVGVGALGSFDGLAALGLFHLALRWAPRRHLALEATLEVAPVGPDVHDPGSSLTARVGCGSAKIWALYAPRLRGRLRPAIGLGLGGLGFWTSGNATTRYQARDVVAAAADLATTVQVGLVLSRQIWLRPMVIAGLTLPRFVVKLGEARVGSFGAPYLAGLLGLELHWP